MGSITASVKRYEVWLEEQLGRQLVQADLDRKHRRMEDSDFLFLRATCFRWTETAHELCPGLMDAPRVIAVGDAHIGNFGLWRDADGRLIWGVNDFDEAAETSYALDLVRLAASALLARGRDRSVSIDEISAAILGGYVEGLRAPAAFVLERRHLWLRDLVLASDEERERFWSALEQLPRAPAPRAYREVLAAALPDSDLTMTTARRVAGLGSLGRPRWVGMADWHGGPVAREAKPLLPSAWSLVQGGDRKLRFAEIAFSKFRIADPWLKPRKGVVVRRLAPNSRKLDFPALADPGLMRRLLTAMGAELANLHSARRSRARAIAGDLEARKPAWLRDAAGRVADATRQDRVAWRGRR
ncbi:MAG: DUF2252 family protein [Inquilinus limosus]|uniref:DUF2252 family protein n=1 Tax=Inquilinus limosus TaxID=171674 RepID=A0A952FFV4_9PROT|nr:DUF2252 family protein [Inquilinus limosus]